VANLCAGGFVLLVESVDILAVDPDPWAGMTLVALAEKQMSFAAGDGDEVVLVFEVDLETKSQNVVVATGGCVVDA
jgi:hypothetical protein